MSRIAVIGCSHSDLNQGVQFYGYGSNWVELMAKQYPHIEFHNYSKGGMGNLYFDTVLKHIIATKPSNYYDCVILQLTTQGRWFVPLTYSPFEEGDIGIWYESDTTVKNLKNVEFNRGYIKIGNNFESFEPWDKGEQYSKHFQSVKEVYNAQGIPTYFDKSFSALSLKLYERFFKTMLVFDWWDGNTDDLYPHMMRVTNIGQDASFWHWMNNKYGIEYVLENLVDETTHCTPLGNKVLFEEYIRNSKLGSYLNEV